MCDNKNSYYYYRSYYCSRHKTAVPPLDVNSVVVAASVVTTVDAATVNRSTNEMSLPIGLLSIKARYFDVEMYHVINPAYML